MSRNRFRVDRRGAVVHDLLHTVLRLLKRLTRSLLFGHIPVDPHHPPHHPVPVMDRHLRRLQRAGLAAGIPEAAVGADDRATIFLHFQILLHERRRLLLREEIKRRLPCNFRRIISSDQLGQRPVHYDVMPFEIPDVNAVRDTIQQGPQRVPLPLQVLLRLDQPADITRDPERPHNAPLLVPERQLRGQDPTLTAVRKKFLLHELLVARATLDDLHLVLARVLGIFRLEVVGIRLPDHLHRRTRAHRLRQRLVHLKEFGLPVLEID